MHVVDRSEATMVIRQDGQIRAWVWRGRLHTIAVELTAWTGQDGRRWHRVEDTDRVRFLLGQSTNGWVALPWPPVPALYQLPKPEVPKAIHGTRTRLPRNSHNATAGLSHWAPVYSK